jgi:nucleotide-binding universal stress UspA family protein
MPVVVGIVATPEGRAALEAAVADAALRGTELVLVTARPVPAAPDVAGTADVDPATSDALALADAAGVVVRLAPSSAETEVAARLVDAAERTGADVIVIGLRRRSPVGKLVLGAGAQRTLLDAPCPVLAVKPAP